ncbi:MAG TPA: hypothetical protein V6D11_31585 [Waterburya sp.]|jgi:hypothetical protein
MKNTEITTNSVVSTQEKARSLMLNQQRTVKNRQRSMLYRSAAEVGLVDPNF